MDITSMNTKYSLQYVIFISLILLLTKKALPRSTGKSSVGDNLLCDSDKLNRKCTKSNLSSNKANLNTLSTNDLKNVNKNNLIRLRRTILTEDEEPVDEGYVIDYAGVQVTAEEFNSFPDNMQIQLKQWPKAGLQKGRFERSSTSGLSLTIIPSSLLYYEDSEPVSLIVNPAQLTANLGVEYVLVIMLNALDGENEVLNLNTFTLTKTVDVGGRNVTFTYEVSPAYTYENNILNITGLANTAEYEAAINTLKYVNTAEEATPSVRGATITVHDSATTTSANVFFTVLSQNDSPSFSTQPSDWTVTEDETFYSPITSSSISLLGDIIVDPDVSSQLGIAVLGADNSHGSWVFGNSLGLPTSISDGVRDSDGNILRNTSLTQTCVVLKEQYIGFVPNDDFTGTTTITVVAWDRTGTTSSLSHGSFTNVTWTAPGDPFSQEMVTVTLHVTSVNDAPHVTLSSSPPVLQLDSVDEGSDGGNGVAVSKLIEACDDVDLTYDSATFNLGVAITQVDFSNGNWQYTINSGTNWTNMSSTAVLLGANGDTNNGKIRFAANSKYYGDANLMYRCWDFTTGIQGDAGVTASYTGVTGSFSNLEVTGIITVNKVNDRPYFVSGTTSIQLPVYSNSVQANQRGTTIADLLSSYFRDDDASDQPGMAVVGLEETWGEFQYTCDVIDGLAVTTSTARWYALISANGPGYAPYAKPDSTRAILLSSNCSLRFTANSSSSASSNMEVLAWDASDGLAAGSYNVNISSVTGNSFGTEVILVEANSTLIYDRPMVSGSQESLLFTEGDSTLVVFPDIVLSQITSGQSARVFLTNPMDNDEALQIGTSYGYSSEAELINATGLSVTWNDANNSVVFTGDAISSAYELVIRSVIYQHLSDNPTTSTARIIELDVTDSGGVTSDAFQRNVTLVAVNDLPTISTNADVTSSWTIVDFTAGNDQVLLYGDSVTIVVSDLDDDAPSSITISIDNAYDGSNEVLSIPGTINKQTVVNSSYYYVEVLETSSSYDVTSSTLSFSILGDAITFNDYTQALRDVSYGNAANPPDFRHRTVRLRAADASGQLTSEVVITVSVLASDGSTVVDIPDDNLPGAPVFAQILAQPLTTSSTTSRSSAAVDADAKISSGDIIEITFDRETNMPPFGYYDTNDPVASAEKILSKSDIDELFVFDDPLQGDTTVTNAYSGQWISSNKFQISIIREGYPQPSVKIGDWRVAAKYRIDCYASADASITVQQYCIRDATGKSNVTFEFSPPLEGSWGLNVPYPTSIVVHDDQKSSGTSYVTDNTLSVIYFRPALSKSQLDAICALDFQAIFGSDFPTHFPGLSATLSTCANSYVSNWDVALDKTDQIPTVSSIVARMQTSTPYLSSEVVARMKSGFNQTAVVEVIADDTGVDKTTLQSYVSTQTRSAPETLIENQDSTTPSVILFSITRPNSSQVDASDVIIRTGDIITVVFDRITNTPEVFSKADLLKIFTFSPSTVNNFVGEWIGQTTLAISLTDVTEAISSLTATFNSNRLSDGSYVPEGFTDRPQCVGNMVCGNDDLSVGICDVSSTSCRAHGSMVFVHTSPTSMAVTSSSTIGWWWLLLLGIVLFICCVLIAWLVCKVKKQRNENEKKSRTNYDGYESIPPSTPASITIPYKSAHSFSVANHAVIGLKQTSNTSPTKRKDESNRSRTPTPIGNGKTPLSARISRRIVPSSDMGVFNVSGGVLDADDGSSEYQRKVHFAPTAGNPLQRSRSSTDTASSDIFASSSSEESGNLDQSESEVTLRFNSPEDHDVPRELSPDVQFQSDKKDVLDLRTRIIYDGPNTSETPPSDLQYSKNVMGSKISMNTSQKETNEWSTLDRSLFVQQKWQQGVSLNKEMDLTSSNRRFSAQESNQKRKRNVSSSLNSSEFMSGDLLDDVKTSSIKASAEFEYIPSFLTRSDGSLRSISEQFTTMSSISELSTLNNVGNGQERHRASISGLPISWYVNGAPSTSDSSCDILMDDEMKHSSRVSSRLSASSGRRGLKTEALSEA
ncbi:uncharacterized protein LOC143451760 [Clavelina lepadiformis]|uniref:uncharacterized protein LOC143451760 n=1 Tax=Clavelina lepadiformis TaxID=159417 RepID=UPI0040412F7F